MHVNSVVPSDAVIIRRLGEMCDSEGDKIQSLHYHTEVGPHRFCSETSIGLLDTFIALCNCNPCKHKFEQLIRLIRFLKNFVNLFYLQIFQGGLKRCWM